MQKKTAPFWRKLVAHLIFWPAMIGGLIAAMIWFDGLRTAAVLQYCSPDTFFAGDMHPGLEQGLGAAGGIVAAIVCTAYLDRFAPGWMRAGFQVPTTSVWKPIWYGAMVFALCAVVGVGVLARHTVFCANPHGVSAWNWPSTISVSYSWRAVTGVQAVCRKSFLSKRTWTYGYILTTSDGTKLSLLTTDSYLWEDAYPQLKADVHPFLRQFDVSAVGYFCPASWTARMLMRP